MTIQTLGQTANFTITYDDALPNALQRAQALEQQCESDFADLKSVFGVTSGFGSANRVTLRVDPQGNQAYNNGYRSDGSSLVVINPQETWSDQAQADDAVQALFVAEVVEILMAYNNQRGGTVTWNPGHSDGEGLSRVLAGMWHPAGYYDVLGGPYVNGWLLSATRPDWVTQTYGTDTDLSSFGCSILFIYYLYGQLGYDLGSIVTKAGSTLEATYESLTGHGGGYGAFTGLLAQFLPVGNTHALATDDPFPLQLAAGDRRVVVSTAESTTGPAEVASSGQATVVPPFCTQPGVFQYWIDDVPVLLRVTAEADGFGQPLYSWKVNGQQLSAIGGTVDTTTTVLVDNPDDPSAPTGTSQQVELFCTVRSNASDYRRMAGELDITVSGFPGHVELNLECDVTEEFVDNGASVGFDSAFADTQRLRYDQQYYLDSTTCRAEWMALVERLERYRHVIILLTLPDPPPYIEKAIAFIEGVSRELGELRREEPERARELAGLLARRLGAPETWLRGGSEERSG